MKTKHDAVFDDVLDGFDAPQPVETSPSKDRSGARFLKRSTTISDRIAGEIEEKTLRWVDPSECRMWGQHNRDYGLLNEENCRDLIDGIRAQGRQEFPAVVRAINSDTGPRYEVICGARRHFAVSWLRANNYTQFKYLVEVREMTDEEAFRLADIENRDREDISDYERAIDYADAIQRYYGGKQKAMAERLEVSQPWLSRYLQLAKLPQDIVQSFPSIRDIKERNARELKPLLAANGSAELLMAEARKLVAEQARAKAGRGPFIDAQTVMRRLVQAARPKPVSAPVQSAREYMRSPGETPITMHRKGRKVVVEFESSMSRAALEAALGHLLDDLYSA